MDHMALVGQLTIDILLPGVWSIERVDIFLKTRAKRERAIFMGPKAWRALRLQVDVDNELHGGEASLMQLLWLLDEHQPCVVVVDRSGARFHRFWMGEV